jgi:hypothetical protein
MLQLWLPARRTLSWHEAPMGKFSVDLPDMNNAV